MIPMQGAGIRFVVREWDPTSYPTISSSVVPFPCLQSFPASGSFLKSWLFESGGQSIGASALASVLPMNIPLGLTAFISLQSRGLSRVLSSTTIRKRQSQCSAFFMVQLSHPYMTTGKNHSFDSFEFLESLNENVNLICLRAWIPLSLYLSLLRFMGKKEHRQHNVKMSHVSLTVNMLFMKQD